MLIDVTHINKRFLETWIICNNTKDVLRPENLIPTLQSSETQHYGWSQRPSQGHPKTQLPAWLLKGTISEEPQPPLQPPPGPPRNPGSGVQLCLALSCHLKWRASPTLPPGPLQNKSGPGPALPMWARPRGLTMVSSAAAQRRDRTSTATTDATRPTAAAALRKLPRIGPLLRRRILALSASGRIEAWIPASDWPLLDARSMAPSDWMRLWREGCRLAKGGAFWFILGYFGWSGRGFPCMGPRTFSCV